MRRLDEEVELLFLILKYPYACITNSRLREQEGLYAIRLLLLLRYSSHLPPDHYLHICITPNSN
jgi:hypothetical protein